MHLRNITSIFLIAGILAVPYATRAAEGATYEVDPDANLFSNPHTVDGATYEVQGALEPITGSSEGDDFLVESGGTFSWYCGDGFIDPDEVCDPGEALGGASCDSEGFDGGGDLDCEADCSALDTSACIEDAPGGGGGGGGGRTFGIIPDAPVLGSPFVTSGQFTYNSPFLIYGTKTLSTDIIIVNNLIDGVRYPTEKSWTARIDMARYGWNNFTFLARNIGGDSVKVAYQIYYRLKGDITQNNVVDDYDLSRFVRLWGTSDRNSDFNETGMTDDYDFSLLVSRWGSAV
jgi:hypothetical protein